MEKQIDVLAIGLIVQDILVKPVPKQLPETDSVVVEECVYMPGGDAMNQSIILSRLGAKVALAGKVGDDASGRMLVQHAERFGINTSCVKVDNKCNTSTSIVLINEQGERKFIFYKGGNNAFTIDDIELSVLGSTRVVSFGSIFGLQAFDGVGAETLFKEAKKSNVVTVADAVRDKVGLGLNGIKGLLEYTDIFIPSYSEAKYLTNETEPENMADVLLDCGVKNVVIKLGDEGCFIKAGNNSRIISPYRTNAVDTTGAGDNFVAGFITGILKDWSIWECGEFANAVGALAVQEIGATSAVKSIQHVNEFIRNSKKDIV
jgi:sugar/nucleoside kinase (ribokinase family)